MYDLILTASDGGEPVKSGSAGIQVIVLDANDNVPIFSQPIYEISIKENIPKGFTILTNDNVPEILYPSPPADGYTGIELAPHFSEPGYLVIKVVAVDANSGQNSWLSYQLIRATEPGLFTLGFHTGEIRTAWLFLEENALKQILVVLVKDNVHPAPFALTILMVVLADHIPNILTELSNILFSGDSQSDLTFSSVIAVDLDSCLFFTFLFIFFSYTF
ncbi:Protocadherin gamma-A9, partial [Ophiophagus hannah]